MAVGGAQFGFRAKLLILSRVPIDKKTAAATLFEITDLRIVWRYKKSWLWTPNNGEIQIYNFAEESRAKMVAAKGLKAALFGGYGGDFPQICVMDIKQANSRHEQPNWITKLEGGDGARAWAYSHANLSFGKNTPAVAVISGLVDSIGKRLAAASIPELNAATAGGLFKNGYNVNGAAAPALRDVAAQFGLAMSFQDDEVRLAKPDQGLKEIFEISPDSGLIKSPEYASPPVPGKPQLIKAEILHNAAIKVWSTVRLRSTAHDGEFVVRELTHSGDTAPGGQHITELQLLGKKGAR